MVCFTVSLHIRLQRCHSASLLAGARFALYCLGDRAYGSQFCAAGRKLGARLVQLGAEPTCAVGYGDDGTPNGGVFADFDDWLMQSLLPTLPTRTSPIIVRPSTNAYSVQKTAFEEDDGYEEFFTSSCPLTAYAYQDGKRIAEHHARNRKPMEGAVLRNDRVTAESWQQNTRHIALELAHLLINPSYNAGDVATILPFNSSANVAKFLSVLPQTLQDAADTRIEVGYDPDQHRSSTPWPRRCTLRGLLTYCMDIQSLPEREDMRALSFYCTNDEEQREKLVSLSETSGAALYADYVLREKRCWADVLFDFDGVQIASVETLLALLPPMQPRHFSIASPPTKNVVELCVAVVEGTTPLGRPYQGLCSSYLAALEQGDAVRLWIRPGSFGKLPLDLIQGTNHFDTPVLYIGAGTGIAPLRSLILQREHVRSKQQEGIENQPALAPDSTLLFGCRQRTSDFYYQDEWETLQRNQKLRLLTAFSRDQWHKVYVQQVLRDADIVATHVLEKGGAVYIAGGAKMARAVKDELAECLGRAMEGGTATALRLLKKLQLRGKFSVEAWN